MFRSSSVTARTSHNGIRISQCKVFKYVLLKKGKQILSKEKRPLFLALPFIEISLFLNTSRRISTSRSTMLCIKPSFNLFSTYLSL